MEKLTDMATQMKVNFVIENLCRQEHGVHLFSNEEYFRISKISRRRSL